MKITKAIYLISCVKKAQFPNPTLPQYLLVGRSNVGKSSFINTLCNRKQLAYTSSKPGKTQTLNFYLCNDSFMLVDAPGYGYSKQSKEDRVKYGLLLEEILNSDVNLKKVIQIIDIRHPLSDDDLAVYEFLKQFNKPIMIILTKADKLGKNDLIKQINYFKTIFAENIYPFSAETKYGLEQVQENLIN